ncbi:hypothetical protein JHK85_010076 [Glycine max]|nr:hypothetical protein JHK85_010076 [Glycine max]
MVRTSTTTIKSYPNGKNFNFPLLTFPSTGLSYHINCGTSTKSTDSFNTTWLSDDFISSGSSAIVSKPLQFPLPSAKTLHFFLPSFSDKINCYTFPSLPSPSHYLLCTFIVYNNYDAKFIRPSFNVALSSIVIFNWCAPWPESTARKGTYYDLFASLPNTSSSSSSSLNHCFYDFATDSLLVSSIELIQVHPTAYTNSNNLLLINYSRISWASTKPWGTGFTNHTEGRVCEEC